MNLSYKYRLYPTKNQAEFLTGQINAACELYNCALQERKDAWKTCRKSISFADQDRQIKDLRRENLLGLCNVGVATDVLRRLDKAYAKFYKKKGAGFPRFKSRKRFRSITFRYPSNGCKWLKEGRLRIQDGGHFKFKQHRPIVGVIKIVTIIRDYERWFVSFVTEVDAAPLPSNNEQVGLDLGFNTFAYLSDGTEIDKPKFNAASQKELRRAQRRVARRTKNGKRRQKASRLFQKVWARVRDRRADFSHKASRWVINSYGVVVVENLLVSQMQASMFSKSITEAGWTSFTRKLSYKAESAGRVFVKVDPRGTSQTCLCGASVPKTLADRWHSCPACGLEGPRDLISAQVILQRGRIALSGLNVGVVIPSVS